MPVPTVTDAIFLLLGALLVIGLSLHICSERLYPSPKKMGRRKKLTIYMLCGIAVCIFGAVNIIDIRKSGHSSATGVIVNLQQHLGKHNYSRFRVQREDGSRRMSRRVTPSMFARSRSS